MSVYNIRLRYIKLWLVNVVPRAHLKTWLIFRLDALAKALSVIATATWLGGCPSHSGIVSKRLNVSENFFDHLKAPSF